MFSLLKIFVEKYTNKLGDIPPVLPAVCNWRFPEVNLSVERSLIKLRKYILCFKNDFWLHLKNQFKQDKKEKAVFENENHTFRLCLETEMEILI